MAAAPATARRSTAPRSRGRPRIGCCRARTSPCGSRRARRSGARTATRSPTDDARPAAARGGQRGLGRRRRAARGRSADAPPSRPVRRGASGAPDPRCRWGRRRHAALPRRRVRRRCAGGCSFPGRREPIERILSKWRIATRTEAQRLVREGRVSVGGARVGDPRAFVDPRSDRIEVDGRVVGPPEAGTVWLALNKPRGVVTTTKDPEGRRTVMDLVAPATVRGSPPWAGSTRRAPACSS